MTYYFCTYFDKNYLPQGLALYHSLRRKLSSFKLLVLCLDQMSHEILSQNLYHEIETIKLEELEAWDQDLLSIKQSRSLVEYYFTITPILPLYIFSNYQNIRLLSYVDADLYLFGDITYIFNELGDKSIYIVEHGFDGSSHKHTRRGKYNVGFISFRNNQHGQKCLQWWRERCIEWCHDYYEDGKYADQKYLDDFPVRFQEVVASKNVNVCVGPWNLFDGRISCSKRLYYLNGAPIIFYHFHGIKLLRSWLAAPGFHTDRIKWSHGLQRLYCKYAMVILPLLKVAGIRFTNDVRNHDEAKPATSLLNRLLVEKHLIVMGPLNFYMNLAKYTQKLVLLKNKLTFRPR